MDLDKKDLINSVLEIANTAGQALHTLYKRNLHNQIQSSVKEDGSLYTQADQVSHQIISQGLAQLTPTIPVISEENPESFKYQRSDISFWLIDPLDGTKEFITQSNEFTLNIALIQNGQPVLGIVMAPALDLLYWGGAHLGAFRKNKDKIQAIHIRHLNQEQHCIKIIASKSHFTEQTKTFISNLPCYELVYAGSALKFCKIAEGLADCYPRLGVTHEWDTAAGQAILEAAGGYVQTLDGQLLCYGKACNKNPFFVAGGGNRFFALLANFITGF